MTRVIELKEDGHIELALQEFQKALNEQPKNIEKDYRGFYTLPISHVEMMLDTFFLGQWDTQNFTWQVIENEVVATIQLCVSNPLTGLVRCLTGAAAVQILVPKGKEKLNLKNKIVNCMENGFPKLEAMCIKSAAKKLGKRFGRDLNRDKTADMYEMLAVDDETEQDDQVIDELMQTEDE